MTIQVKGHKRKWSLDNQAGNGTIPILIIRRIAHIKQVQRGM